MPLPIPNSTQTLWATTADHLGIVEKSRKVRAREREEKREGKKLTRKWGCCMHRHLPSPFAPFSLLGCTYCIILYLPSYWWLQQLCLALCSIMLCSVYIICYLLVMVQLPKCEVSWITILCQATSSEKHKRWNPIFEYRNKLV